MTTESVLNEVQAERTYQNQKWGCQTDDRINTPWMWVAYITAYASKWMVGSFSPLGASTTDAFRKAMVKVAAIAVAAVESVDRQRAAGGKCFYE